MATINREIIVEMMNNEGRYKDHPIPYVIFQYTDLSENKLFDICFSYLEAGNLLSSSKISSVNLLWSKRYGTTSVGSAFLKDC
jgi:hypothetical protein